MKVTRIYRGKKSNRINIDIEEEFGFSVEEDTLIKFDLYVGREINESFVKEIEEFDRSEYLFNKAVGYIARRPRSEKEICEYLEEKSTKRFGEINAGSIAKAIDKLKGREYLSDAEFTAWFAETRINQRKYSAFQIRSELALKFGIDKELIGNILAKQNIEEKERDAIESLISKKLGRYKSKEKMAQYLKNKGFDWDNIKTALNI
ncbi:RecX family transcriptional regulator [Candidatus Dojkabacteria bacterium]|nr:RecX family transcriptional regulator [Candidatus Dojkabacteria bacterium]